MKNVNVTKFDLVSRIKTPHLGSLTLGLAGPGLSNCKRKLAMSTRKFLITTILLLSTSIALATGPGSGAGGLLLPSSDRKATAQEVVQAMKYAKAHLSELLLGLMRPNSEERLTDLVLFDVLPNHPAQGLDSYGFYRKVVFPYVVRPSTLGILDALDFVTPSQLTSGDRSKCLDLNGDAKDGTAFNKDPREVCFDDVAIAEKTTIYNVWRDVAALAAHEVAHRVGGDEDVAIAFQKLVDKLILQGGDEWLKLDLRKQEFKRQVIAFGQTLRTTVQSIQQNSSPVLTCGLEMASVQAFEGLQPSKKGFDISSNQSKAWLNVIQAKIMVSARNCFLEKDFVMKSYEDHRLSQWLGWDSGFMEDFFAKEKSRSVLELIGFVEDFKLSTNRRPDISARFVPYDFVGFVRKPTLNSMSTLKTELVDVYDWTKQLCVSLSSSGFKRDCEIELPALY